MDIIQRWCELKGSKQWRQGLRRALKIGYYKNDPICVLTTVSVLWELRLLETDGVKCAFNDNEYFCCTDTPSMSLSYPLQTLDAFFLIKSLFETNTQADKQEAALCVCWWAALWYTVLSQENVGTSTEAPQSGVLTVTSVPCCVSSAHRHNNFIKIFIYISASLLLLRQTTDWLSYFISDSDICPQLFPAHIVLLGPSWTVLVNKVALVSLLARHRR